MELKFIRTVPLFSDLTDEEIERILQLAFVKEYNEGVVLFIDGMQGSIMYVIIEGEVSILKKLNGVETEIARLGDGSYFGELSLIENDKRSATAKLTKSSTLMVITKKCFDQMLQIEPSMSSKLLLKFLITTSKGLRETTEKLDNC